MIAALFVATGGVYFNRPDVDPYDIKRDAMTYRGPHPVVAHPPCARWCRLAGLVEKRWGHKKGDDGGTFAHALHCVRTYGGVLEHPAYSDAFARYGLPIPTDKGGWQMGLCGGWSCHVEQWHYGHRAKKATWLYAWGATELPSLRWGATPDNIQTAYVRDSPGKRFAARALGLTYQTDYAGPKRGLVSWCGNHVKDGEKRERLGRLAASATPPRVRGDASQSGAVRPVELLGHRARLVTPPPFAELLLSIARSVE